MLFADYLLPPLVKYNKDIGGVDCTAIYVSTFKNGWLEIRELISFSKYYSVRETGRRHGRIILAIKEEQPPPKKQKK